MTATHSNTRLDVYTRITNRILEDLTKGVLPWLKPWNAEHLAGRISRPLRQNGQPYQGINILMLWDAAEQGGLTSPYWMTFSQAKEFGGSVKKGEQGSPVVYASTFKKKDVADDGQEIEAEIPFLKEYKVFNASQIAGLPERFYPTREEPQDLPPRIERAETFFAHTKAEIRTGGNQAYYSVSGDYVQMPPFETFRDAEAYAAVKAHELCHWTRAEHRLHRDLGRKRWGDAGYALEELVAELGSAFLCADLQITPEVREDHAAYISSWLKVLQDDKRAIFTAASHASKAVDYMHGLQPAVSLVSPNGDASEGISTGATE